MVHDARPAGLLRGASTLDLDALNLCMAGSMLAMGLVVAIFQWRLYRLRKRYRDQPDEEALDRHSQLSPPPPDALRGPSEGSVSDDA